MSDKAAASQESKEVIFRLIALESLMVALLGVQEIERPGFCALIAEKLDQQLGQQTESPHKEALVELRLRMRSLLDPVSNAQAEKSESWLDRLRRKIFGRTDLK